MLVWSDGAGGTYIGDPGTNEDRLKYTITVSDDAMGSNLVRATMQTAGGAAITGAGVKVGIISDSFDAYAPGVGSSDPANQDAIDGYLPLNAATQTCAVQVLQEGTPGSSDEGRAMAELVHQVAPGASLAFCTAGASEADMASAVNQLVAAGCNVIVDDISFYDEPFFQVAGTLDTAIEAAVASGVDYFTSAGNSGDASYQASFTPQAEQLPGSLATVQAQIFDNGTPYQTVTIGTATTISLEWATPWPTNGASVPAALVMALYTTAGQLVARSFQVDGEPCEELSVPAAGTYLLAIYQPSGAPAVGTFKYIIDREGSIDDAAAANGASTVIGHELLTDVNTVGAINAADAAAFGTPSDWTKSYSSVGPGTLLYDSSGNALATPTSAGKVDFVAPDAAATTVSTVSSASGPFEGTSAAAPDAAAVAALMRQANPALTPAQVTQDLAASALPMGLPVAQQGAGLIQAPGAVALALGNTAITAQAVSTIYDAVLRSVPSTGTAAQYAAEINAGTLTLAQFESQLFAQAATTTVPALVTYNAFYGALPGSAGLDFLTAYTAGLPAEGFSTLNIWVNLGASFAANGSFGAAYAALTRTAFVDSAYATIFGQAPSADAEATLVNSLGFYATYAGSELGARGAVEGVMLYLADQQANSPYALAAASFLQHAAAGTAQYQVNLLSTYTGTGALAS